VAYVDTRCRFDCFGRISTENSASFVQKFQHKIVNIHPLLLPKYGGENMYGDNVHFAVIANREKESGITIHFVDEGYDTGKVIFKPLAR
jgi:phosphoribosylglycinamide formyltransferase 1